MEYVIIWGNVDPVLCRHIAPLGHNKLRAIWELKVKETELR